MMSNVFNFKIGVMSNKAYCKIGMVFDRLPASAGVGMVFDFHYMKVGMMFDYLHVKVGMMFDHLYSSIKGDVSTFAVFDGFGAGQCQCKQY
jgi:hypothetical protein